MELAALLVDTVCVPGSGEQEALGELAGFLGVERGSMESELMFLRAFAVDFAVLLALGDSPAKDQILSRYYEHWERIDAEVEGTLAILEERLQDYAAIIGDIEPGTGGLARQLGIALAARCGVKDNPDAGELMIFGGRLFAALYEEVTAMLTEVEIVLLEE